MTSREREILELIATEMSNRAISAHLVLSVRTVERHTLNIYANLGVRGMSRQSPSGSSTRRPPALLGRGWVISAHSSGPPLTLGWPESRCQARRDRPAATSSARICQAAVGTRRSQPMAGTYPIRWASSSARRAGSATCPQWTFCS
ncbi:response regulator transcription factor [Pseudonocardia sp.]|uniref:response regulator transcription factor n=1 Tax=Pseudonocardia sp. TaxID=60912 RepID=UPI0026250682|nr:helix-turn-helix transcriptional regulator [Pseudonocardia sp.]